MVRDLLRAVIRPFSWSCETECDNRQERLYSTSKRDNVAKTSRLVDGFNFAQVPQLV